jgi:hypothetical protein
MMIAMHETELVAVDGGNEPPIKICPWFQICPTEELFF